MATQKRAFIAGMTCGALLAASIAAIGQVGDSGERSTAAPSTAELRRFTSAFDAVRRNYVTEVNDGKLIDGCIGGMLRGLDPQSGYMDATEFREMIASNSPQRGGLGLELTTVGDHVFVVAPLEGTPAQRGGVLAGDRVLKIDDTETLGLSVAEVVKLLVGPSGTPVRLTLVRSGMSEPVRLTLTREAIKVQELRSSIAAPGFGYVRISQFRETTPDTFARALAALRTENGGALKGLVLDLRGNPGGLLQSAIAIAAAFLQEDRVVLSMKGRNKDSSRQYTANPRDYEPTSLLKSPRPPEDTRTLPLVVLVNHSSAAGSEIIAGALQDHGRATIVGEKTFGRGSIQTIMPMGAVTARDSTAIKLTTAYWYTPKGHVIHAQGIAPDVALDPATAKPEAFNYGGTNDPALQRALEILRR